MVVIVYVGCSGLGQQNVFVSQVFVIFIILSLYDDFIIL